MEPSDIPVQPTSSTQAEAIGNSVSANSSNSMSEFYQLKRELLSSTLILAGLCFGPVWWVYSLNVALSYLLGAFAGVVYLRLLAKNVEQLGSQNTQVGKNQIAVFIGVFIVATQWDQLQVLPVFLGFLTYKAAIIVFMVRTAVLPPTNSHG